VRILIKAGVDLEFGVISYPPLHVASENGHTKIMKLLLNEGANPDTPDLHENRPIHLAAKAGKNEAIKLLLDNGVDPDSYNDDTDTPLLLAARGGHLDTLSLLLEAGATVNVCDASDSTPLHNAAIGGHQQALKLLIEKGAEVLATDSKGRIPLHLAAENGHSDIVTCLLEQKTDLPQQKAADKNGSSALHLAAKNGHNKVLSILLEARSDYNALNKNGTPLSLAVENGNLESARMLLNCGAYLMSSKGDMRDTLNNLDRGGLTDLHLAAKCGIDMTKLLLERGAKEDLDALDSAEKSPLYWAIYAGNLTLVKYLLDAGANANASKSWPAMMTAAYWGRVDIVQEFLRRTIDMRKGQFNWTPLHIAYDTSEIIELLLKAGAEPEINAVDTEGQTALMK